MSYEKELAKCVDTDNNRINIAVETSASVVTLTKNVGFKYVSGSSATKNCTGSGTDDTQAGLTVGDIYDITNLNASALVYIGAADITTASNRDMTIPPYQTRRYELTDTTLHYGSDTASAKMEYSKVDIS